jgi:hypothetical protein
MATIQFAAIAAGAAKAAAALCDAGAAVRDPAEYPAQACIYCGGEYVPQFETHGGPRGCAEDLQPWTIMGLKLFTACLQRRCLQASFGFAPFKVEQRYNSTATTGHNNRPQQPL